MRGLAAMDLRRIKLGHGSEAGFTVIELAIVIVLIGLLLMPIIKLATASFGSTRDEKTQIALETARDALIAYAATNNGCLPFSADFEGGLPDTDASGNATPGFVDTGDSQNNSNNNSHAGDLPWADLGLTNGFVDGDQLRIQYYVATQYTDTDADADNGIDCLAGFRGFEWKSSITYNGGTTPVYVYYDPLPEVPVPGDRRLYKLTGNNALLAGNSPDANLAPGIVEDVTNPLPASLLEVRRGPDVINGTAVETTAVSARNVFVLIAPGSNRNADHNRRYFRDSNHRGDAGGSLWSPDSSNNIDIVVISATRNIDATDHGDDGDDTLLATSFIQYKAELSAYGLNMEPICDAIC